MSKGKNLNNLTIHSKMIIKTLRSLYYALLAIIPLLTLLAYETYQNNLDDYKSLEEKRVTFRLEESYVNGLIQSCSDTGKHILLFEKMLVLETDSMNMLRREIKDEVIKVIRLRSENKNDSLETLNLMVKQKNLIEMIQEDALAAQEYR